MPLMCHAIGMKNKNRRELERFWADKAKKSTQANKGSSAPARKSINQSAAGKSTQPPKSM
jgi:hypothetical protein